MPKVGDKDFPYTDEGIKQAAAESAVSGIPVSNAGERSATTYAGGGKTGYNAVGNPMYKHGGNTLENKKETRFRNKQKKRMPFTEDEVISGPDKRPNEILKNLFGKKKKFKGKKA